MKENNLKKEKNSISFVYLPDEDDGPLKNCPNVSVLGVIVINVGVSTVHDITGHDARKNGAKEKRQGAKQDLVPFQFRREPLGWLTLPFFRSIALTHVVIPMEETADSQIRHVRNDGGRNNVIRQSFQFVILERKTAVKRILFVLDLLLGYCPVVFILLTVA
jgi:hypothetical protein